MAEPVDQDDLEDSNKALVVIFILAILASTGYFFYKILDRQWRFFYNTRTYMVVILTAGDFFIAIFSLFVYARAIYEKRYRPGCSTSLCALVYFSYYFPFVYATGLICLCVELVFRHRIRAFFPKPEFSSVALAGIPWLLGLVLILPLTMAGMDWYNCTFDSDSDSRSRDRAKVWISVVLPSALAVVVCFIVKQARFSVVPKERYSGQTRPPPPTHTPLRSGHADAEPNTYSYGSITSQPNIPNPQVNDSGTSNTSMENVSSEVPIAAESYLSNFSVEKEKIFNLAIAGTFFFLTMPYALFILGYEYNDDQEPLDPIPERVLERLFYWLVVARSAVLPVLWTIFLPKSPVVYADY